MITILGNPTDIVPYADKPDYNTHTPDMTPEQVRNWISERVDAGDDFRLVSKKFTGLYGREACWLLDEAQQKRCQARTLEDRALDLSEAVRDARRRSMALD